MSGSAHFIPQYIKSSLQAMWRRQSKVNSWESNWKTGPHRLSTTMSRWVTPKMTKLVEEWVDLPCRWCSDLQVQPPASAPRPPCLDLSFSVKPKRHLQRTDNDGHTSKRCTLHPYSISRCWQYTVHVVIQTDKSSFKFADNPATSGQAEIQGLKLRCGMDLLVQKTLSEWKRAWSLIML